MRDQVCWLLNTVTSSISVCMEFIFVPHKGWKIANKSQVGTFRWWMPRRKRSLMCADWMERKISNSVVISPLSVSSKVKHLLRCWVWLLWCLLSLKLALSRLYFFLIFQGSHSFIEISHLTLCLTFYQLLHLPLVPPVQRWHTSFCLWACSPYLAVKL